MDEENIVQSEIGTEGEVRAETAVQGAEGETAEKRGVWARVKGYLRELPKRWFITAFSGMAQGLFVTLIAGTILAQIAGWIGDNYIGNVLLAIANMAKTLMGAGIGVGIAYALKKQRLILFSAASPARKAINSLSI